MRLFSLLGAASLAAAATLTPSAVVLNEGGGDDQLCEPAAFGRSLPADEDSAAALQLFLSNPVEACEAPAAPADASGDWALLVHRGTCTFAEKAALAASAGASGIVVMNTLEALYDAGLGDCDYDCDEGSWTQAATSDDLWDLSNQASGCSGGCESGLCVFPSTSSDQQCCLRENYITMGDDDGLVADDALYAVYTTLSAGEALTAELSAADDGALAVGLAYRDVASFEFSSVLIWAMGVATAVYAAWYSAREYRQDVGAVMAVDSLLRDDDFETLDMSVYHGAGFLCFGSAFLLILYFTSVYVVVTVLFCLGAETSVLHILARPLLKKHAPALVQTAYELPVCGRTTQLDLAAHGCSAALVLWWVLAEGTSYAWVLQDLFGVCLCILSLSVIRFPSIKVAAALLTAAFVYDVFFVFITPLFFESSVMIEVATAGGSDGECEDDDILPILLMLPRISDWQEGYTMLGLGDIVLPGLLLSFALRYDYCSDWSVRQGYFRLVSLGYAVGLAMAMIAVYAMDTGQPALLYLVPCTLGVFCFFAHRDGVLREAWEGPRCMRTELDVEMDVASNSLLGGDSFQNQGVEDEDELVL